MNKIILRLEYRCFLMWIYDEHETMLDNDLVIELSNNDIIDNLLTSIQKDYDSLFIDNDKEFSFKGFLNEGERIKFENKMEKAYQVIKNEVGKIYLIENLVNIANLQSNNYKNK